MQIMTMLEKSDIESIIKMDSMEIIDKLKQSGLKGRSGSNFSTGLKWEMTKNAPGKKALICNADEGEPGTFKDKLIIEKNPELLLWGIEAGRRALDAECFIYLRGEYEYLRKGLEEKIKELGFPITVVSGAGSYVCGEETALMESIEGNRGMPRYKPPYPSTCGLWKRPTCINNVETLANIPLILSGKWKPELRLFSLSGNVKKPGVYEIAAGMKLSEIASLCDASNPKAVCLGYSGGIIPYEKFSGTQVDDKSFSEHSFFIGPGSMIFLDMDISKILLNIAEFYVHESCGKCIPCREGGYRMLEIIRKIDSGKATKDDMEELEELAEYMDIAFCLLGKSYGFVVKSAINGFREELESGLRC